MHNNKLIKKGSKQPLKFQWGGGLLGNLQNTNTPTAEQANQMSNQVPSAIDPMTGKPKIKNGDFLNSAISGSLMGLLSGASSINGINGNSSLNGDQKKMMTGDAVANTLSQVGSAFGPVGAIAGAGLGVLNTLGGKLLGTPKALKDFNVNTDVSTSGGYGGIAADAASTSASAKSYEKAGLFGKLFGGKNNIINSTKMSNSWQNMAADQVRNNTAAINASLGSNDMTASRVNNSLYGGNLWNNGSIMYGAKGGKAPIHIKKSHEGEFTAKAKAAGMGVQEYASSVLANKDKHSGSTVKQANFARNAAKWHQQGGTLMSGNLPKKSREQIVQDGYTSTYGKNPTIVDPLDDILSAPQRGATKLFTGTYQNPSEALGLTNKYTAAGADLVLDPLNALFFLKGRKLGKLAEVARESNYFPGTTINLTHPRDAAKILRKVRNVEMADRVQNVESTYNNLVSNKEGGILKHGMGGQSSSLTDRLLSKDMPAKRYTGGTQVTQLNDGTTKTYEQYKKLLGAAAAIDFKKIKIRKEKLAPMPLPGVKQAMKHEEGGIMKPMNVIVDGALHAHKHELKEHEDLADAPITLKGIPVISQAEGGEIVQHAEVERDELILHYDCSKKLEALYDIGDEESMIIAGKLLTKELIHNTKDSENGIIENA